jgi:hypothetical protein
MSVKEKQEQLVGAMKRWQKIENAAVAQTGKIMEQTDNTLIRLVAEIIQRDSNLHHRVQQTIIESIDREHINLSVDDLEKVWTSIDQHIQIEKNYRACQTKSQRVGRNKTPDPTVSVIVLASRRTET